MRKHYFNEYPDHVEVFDEEERYEKKARVQEALHSKASSRKKGRRECKEETRTHGKATQGGDIR